MSVWSGHSTCWIYEDEKEKKQNKKALAEENRLGEEKALEDQLQAKIPGTPQHVKMHQINEAIVKHDECVKATSEGRNRKCSKRSVKLEQIFKWKTLTRTNDKEIDWYLYRKRILLPLLYPYYLKVRVMNPEREV